MTESYDYPHQAYDPYTYPGTFFSESSSALSHYQHYDGSNMTLTTTNVSVSQCYMKYLARGICPSILTCHATDYRWYARTGNGYLYCPT